MFGSAVGVLDDSALPGLVGALGTLQQDVDAGVRIDRIRVLEEVKAAVGAAQVRETAAFAADRRAAQATAGVRPDRVGRGIAGQVALARRISPYQAGRYVGWAGIFTRELPGTFAHSQ